MVFEISIFYGFGEILRVLIHKKIKKHKNSQIFDFFMVSEILIFFNGFGEILQNLNKNTDARCCV